MEKLIVDIFSNILMKTYLIIIIIIIVIISILFLLSFIPIKEEFAGDLQINLPIDTPTTEEEEMPMSEEMYQEKEEKELEERVYKQDLSFDLVLPPPRTSLVKNNSKTQNMQDGIVLENPLPGDDMVYKEEDKIYINPFFPKEMKDIPNQNYPNPKDMAPTERNAYKFGYPNQMTMQDYINWLFLFKNTPNLLNLEHNINLQKLMNNTPIKYEKDKCPPPAKRLTPLNAEDYFIRQYTQLPTQTNPRFTQLINPDVRVASNQGDPSNGLMAANYDDYSIFSQNFDTFGNTQYIYNPELADKTDPFFLQLYTGPTWTFKQKSPKPS